MSENEDTDSSAYFEKSDSHDLLEKTLLESSENKNDKSDDDDDDDDDDSDSNKNEAQSESDDEIDKWVDEAGNEN